MIDRSRQGRNHLGSIRLRSYRDAYFYYPFHGGFVALRALSPSPPALIDVSFATITLSESGRNCI